MLARQMFRIRCDADLGRHRKMVFHSDRYSSRCSTTTLTARSRVSGEYLFLLVMNILSKGLCLHKTRGDSHRFFANTPESPSVSSSTRVVSARTAYSRDNAINGRCGGTFGYTGSVICCPKYGKSRTSQYRNC